MMDDLLLTLNWLALAVMFVAAGITYKYLDAKKWPRWTPVCAAVLAFVAIATMWFFVYRAVGFPGWMRWPAQLLTENFNSVATPTPMARQLIPVHSSNSNESISTAVAEMFVGLVSATVLHPEQNAIETYAQGFDWRETPAEMNAMLNAKRGFAGKLAGQTVLLGGDGSNDIFSIAVRDNFDSREFQKQLHDVLTLKFGTSDISFGQKTELYRLLDGSKQLGLVSITYGVADAIGGSGTVGYISAARARKEGIGIQ